MEHIVKEILEGSIAQEMEIEPGENILAVSYTHLDVYKRQVCVQNEYQPI